MIKAILMSIPLIAMFAGAADATAIYNWRHVDFVQNNEVITGRIEFSNRAWFARRAEVEFDAVGFPQPGTPEDPPRFFYPFGQDVVSLSFGIRGFDFPPIDLVQGWNQDSRFHLFTDVAFARDRRYLFGSIVADGGGSRVTSFGGVPIRTDWTATAVSDGACSITCVTTGFWELDPTSSVLVPEPGSILLVLAGLLGVGLLTSHSTSLPSSARGSEDCC